MAEVDERVSPRPGTRWTALYDDYEAGTGFLTADPTGSQVPIMAGMPWHVAVAIEKAHNEAIALDRAELAAAVRGRTNPFTGAAHAAYEAARSAFLRLIEGEKGADHAD